MSGDHNTRGQCPSCGGDCGRTAKSGCRYNTPNPKVPKFEVCDTSELSSLLKCKEANAMLVAALDRIHDVLNGVYVDDVALIINRALAANKELLK